MRIIAFLQRLVLRIVVWAGRLKRALKFAMFTFLLLGILLLLAGVYGVWYAGASCDGAVCAAIWGTLGTLSILVAAGMLALGWFLMTRWRAIRLAGSKLGSAP